MKKIILLKLGGSLITDKTKPYTARYGIIKTLSNQIKKALTKNKDIQLIIGNGAGSFGHYPAAQYNLSEGIHNEDQKTGFCIVQDAVARLNRIVVEALLKAGVNAISLHPSSIIMARNKKIAQFFLEPLIAFLSLGVTPIIYVDIVNDEAIGSSIFSTEQLFHEISKRLFKRKIRIDKIIHNGVTKGILDTKGRTIPLIRPNQMNSIKKILYSTEGFDVTGGMLHKLENSIRLAKQGIQTFIIDGVSDDVLYRALIGEKVEGTVIL